MKYLIRKALERLALLGASLRPSHQTKKGEPFLNVPQRNREFHWSKPAFLSFNQELLKHKYKICFKFVYFPFSCGSAVKCYFTCFWEDPAFFQMFVVRLSSPFRQFSVGRSRWNFWHCGNAPSGSNTKAISNLNYFMRFCQCDSQSKQVVIIHALHFWH